MIQSRLVEELPVHVCDGTIHEVIPVHAQSIRRASPGSFATEIRVGTLCVCGCDTAIAVKARNGGGDEGTGGEEQRGDVDGEHREG